MNNINLSQEALNEYKDAFSLFDKDGDGYISNNELGSVLRSLGQCPTQAEVQDMINEVDCDGNGLIDFDEFVNLMQNKLSNEDKEQELVEAFKVFDKNGDGFISLQELKFTLTTIGEKLTEDECNQMMAEADMDNDGRINFNEFVRMMCH